MFARPLSSLSISESSLSALKHAGFENTNDLVSLTAEQLSEGELPAALHPVSLFKSAELKLPAFLCEEILRASRKTLPSFTQPASILLDSTRSVIPVPEPMKSLFDEGGLKKGHILELSGPPGSPKESVLIDVIKAVVPEEDVIFLGRLESRYISVELRFVCRYAEYDYPLGSSVCTQRSVHLRSNAPIY